MKTLIFLQAISFVIALIYVVFLFERKIKILTEELNHHRLMIDKLQEIVTCNTNTIELIVGVESE